MNSFTIKHITGNVLDSDAPIIAHQVNCQGVMGAGVAKCIREKYPDIMTDYVRWCQNYDENYLLGLIQLYRINENEDKFIANCFAQSKKSRYGRLTNYEAFYNSMISLVHAVDHYHLEPRIAFPYKIGCGIGGGDWNIILAIIKSVFSQFDDFTIEFWSLDEFDVIPVVC